MPTSVAVASVERHEIDFPILAPNTRNLKLKSRLVYPRFLVRWTSSAETPQCRAIRFVLYKR